MRHVPPSCGEHAASNRANSSGVYSAGWSCAGVPCGRLYVYRLNSLVAISWRRAAQFSTLRATLSVWRT